MLSEKWRQFCVGLNVISRVSFVGWTQIFMLCSIISNHNTIHNGLVMNRHQDIIWTTAARSAILHLRFIVWYKKKCDYI